MKKCCEMCETFEDDNVLPESGTCFYHGKKSTYIKKKTDVCGCFKFSEAYVLKLRAENAEQRYLLNDGWSDLIGLCNARLVEINELQADRDLQKKALEWVCVNFKNWVLFMKDWVPGGYDSTKYKTYLEREKFLKEFALEQAKAAIDKKESEGA